MPLTKSMLCRYHIINQCLSNKHQRYWSLQQLREELADHDICISNRTLESDLEAMRFDERLGYRAPISYCTTNRGYHYEGGNYSIHKANLTGDDIEALQKASRLLKAYENINCINKLPAIIEKIIAGSNLSKRAYAEAQRIFIESPLPDKYADKVDFLLEAIHHEMGVEMILKSDECEILSKVFMYPFIISISLKTPGMLPD